MWGRYPVIVEASNNDGNTALCLFNIYVQSKFSECRISVHRVDEGWFFFSIV